MIPKLKNKKPPEPGKPIIPGVIDKGKSPYNSDDSSNKRDFIIGFTKATLIKIIEGKKTSP